MENFLEAVKHTESLVEFFKKRRDGALKIAHEAKQKGGPALLTYQHFNAKKPCYDDCINDLKLKRSIAHFEEKARQRLNKIKIGKMSQEDFQKIMGELEVYGEVVAELKKKSPKN